MARIDAEAWAADSAYPGPIYHATSRTAAVAIRAVGFDLSRKRFGRMWGNGVYATPDLGASAAYADLFGADAEVVELRANARGVLRVPLASGRGDDALGQILRAIPDGYARFVEATVTLGRALPGTSSRAEALTRTIVAAGYDALEIVETGLTAVGGAQIVVYDRRKVVVVDG